MGGPHETAAATLRSDHPRACAENRARARAVAGPIPFGENVISAILPHPGTPSIIIQPPCNVSTSNLRASLWRWAFLTCALFARDTTGSGNLPPASNPVDVGLGGLQTSLTTGGYRFMIASAPAGAPGAVPNSFPATASLQNRSPFEIDFTFPNATAADLKFTFRVFDSAGALVWQSEGVKRRQPTTTLPLEKIPALEAHCGDSAQAGRQSARRLGIYTLEASINGDKQIGASAIFEVISDAPPVDPTPSGLGGFVFKADRSSVDGQPTPPGNRRRGRASGGQ